MRHIVILPAHGRWHPWTDPPDPTEPDREHPFRILDSRGYRHRRIDTFGRPWNPFGRAHAILNAIDPLRALYVMLFLRRADVVFCYFESAALVILLLRRAFLFRAKVVIQDLGIPGRWRLRNLILKLVVRRADMLLPVGGNQIAGLVGLGAHPDRVRAMLLATSTDFYVDAGDCPDGYILSMGDDVSRDYPTLIAACRGLTHQVVIRSRKIAIDDATPHIRPIAGQLTTRAYQRLIAGAVLVVLPLHPSPHAGGVSALLEAMASGKATIVSDSPGLADYVAGPDTCRVVPAGDPTRLRQAIDALLADAALRRTLGANARRFALEHCSAETAAARLGELLDDVLAAR